MTAGSYYVFVVTQSPGARSASRGKASSPYDTVPSARTIIGTCA